MKNTLLPKSHNLQNSTRERPLSWFLSRMYLHQIWVLTSEKWTIHSCQNHRFLQDYMWAGSRSPTVSCVCVGGERVRKTVIVRVTSWRRLFFNVGLRFFSLPICRPLVGLFFCILPSCEDPCGWTRWIKWWKHYLLLTISNMNVRSRERRDSSVFLFLFSIVCNLGSRLQNTKNIPKLYPDSEKQECTPVKNANFTEFHAWKTIFVNLTKNASPLNMGFYE